MSLAGWATFGLGATVLLTGIMIAAHLAGWSRMDLPLMLGSDPSRRIAGRSEGIREHARGLPREASQLLKVQGRSMGEVVYRSVVELVRHGGPNRTGHLPAGEDVRFGVHSEVAQHYGVDTEQHPPTSTTLDYVVAAAGG